MTSPSLLRLKRRHRAERRFRWYGRLALTLAGAMLLLLLVNIAIPAFDGLRRTEILLSMDRAEFFLKHKENPDTLIRENLTARFSATDRRARRELLGLLSPGASAALHDPFPPDQSFRPEKIENWLPASDAVDMYMKGHIRADTPEYERPLTDRQIGWIEELHKAGEMRTVFNAAFFTGGDSRDPVQAGFLGAMAGSALTILICLGAAFPVGVMAAVYLEEFAPKNRWRDFIEVNINNLAAVPSIIYGLLGLAIWLNFFGLPRASALAGGLTLALMTLPVIIIATRAAIRAVPASIRHGALALGASPLQTVWHHVLPLALPGILTGAILGVARAIGETAPLLLIGMVAFIADVPGGFTDPATVMPVQIFLWAGSPEMGFAGKTSAGIAVLILLLLLMNAAAIYLRQKYERRW